MVFIGDEVRLIDFDMYFNPYKKIVHIENIKELELQLYQHSGIKIVEHNDNSITFSINPKFTHIRFNLEFQPNHIGIVRLQNEQNEPILFDTQFLDDLREHIEEESLQFENESPIDCMLFSILPIVSKYYFPWFKEKSCTKRSTDWHSLAVTILIFILDWKYPLVSKVEMYTKHTGIERLLEPSNDYPDLVPYLPFMTYLLELDSNEINEDYILCKFDELFPKL